MKNSERRGHKHKLAKVPPQSLGQAIESALNVVGVVGDGRPIFVKILGLEMRVIRSGQAQEYTLHLRISTDTTSTEEQFTPSKRTAKRQKGFKVPQRRYPSYENSDEE